MLGKLFRLALPLGTVMMLISLNTSIPRYFVEHFLGERDLGIFASLAYVQVAGMTVVGALGQSASPRLSRLFAARDWNGFRAFTGKLIGIGVGIGVAGVVVALVAGRQILTLLYSAEYAAEMDVFLWIMLASGLGYVGSFLGYAVTATRKYNLFMLPYGTQTIVALICSVWLISGFGLIGASWVLCVVSLVSCLAPLVILAKAWRTP